MGHMEFENNSWIWDGVCYHPHLFGGIMLTAALLGLSTSYFGGIGVPSFPYFSPSFRIFQKKKGAKKRVRVYMDGCFDLMHYGHANALRQAKALGDELVVGVVGDREIIVNKGPPVLSMEERLVLVSGLKWVDDVIADAPYAITEEFMNHLFNEYKIDYIIHGDDPCLLPDGSDAYALAKKAGRFKQIKRTEGVSSTDILGRILASMKEPKDCADHSETTEQRGPDGINSIQFEETCAKGGHLSHFLPTSRRIVQFSNGKGPGPSARVVYIDGAFDLFHAGHVEILKSARQLGDFLLVGIYNDQTISEYRGSQYPIMDLHERSLSVLACRYVDEVIIGAPWEVTKDMLKNLRDNRNRHVMGNRKTEGHLKATYTRLTILMFDIYSLWKQFKVTTFNISLVVHGTVAENNSCLNGNVDPYLVPKSMGIFRMLESPSKITTTSVAQRIVANHDIYLKRNAKKEASEKKYYEEKKYISGD